MKYRNHNIFPDSDFWPERGFSELQKILDLRGVKIYELRGELMIKLTDLEKLGFTIKR